jgi:hypothetical protein
MKKLLLGTFLIIMAGGLALSGILRFGAFQISSDGTGIISSDTTWTKANSPYCLSEPVRVNEGVTLIVEAGVTVNLDGYYLQVDGTLVAKGSIVDNIQFNEGLISFTESSVGWNEQISSGSVIENAVLNSASVLAIEVSPKLESNVVSGDIFAIESASIISNNTINGILFGNGGALTIANNTVNGKLTANEASVVSHNDVWDVATCGGSSLVTYNNFMNGLIVEGGTLTISNNNIVSGNTSIAEGPDVQFVGPDIGRGGIYVDSGTVTIFDNNITNYNGDGGRAAGISLREDTNAYIHDNVISGFTFFTYHAWGIYGIDVGNVTIERNLITENGNGFGFDTTMDSAMVPQFGFGNILIRNNSITNNFFGFQGNYPPIFQYNNFVGSEYNVKGPSMDATYNWWGTTDKQSISQTFSYSGNVLFVPFLNELNPETTPNLTADMLPQPLAAPTESTSPSQPPENSKPLQTEVYIAAAAVVVVIVVSLAIFLRVRKKNNLPSTSAPDIRGGGKSE